MANKTYKLHCPKEPKVRERVKLIHYESRQVRGTLYKGRPQF